MLKGPPGAPRPPSRPAGLGRQALGTSQWRPRTLWHPMPRPLASVPPAQQTPGGSAASVCSSAPRTAAPSARRPPPDARAARGRALRGGPGFRSWPCRLQLGDPHRWQDQGSGRWPGEEEGSVPGGWGHPSREPPQTPLGAGQPARIYPRRCRACHSDLIPALCQPATEALGCHLPVPGDVTGRECGGRGR